MSVSVKINVKTSPHLRGLSPLDPRVRNDPVYRKDRIRHLEEKLRNKEQFILISRLDSDVRNLAIRYHLPIETTVQDATQSRALVYPFSRLRACDNPICAAVSFPLYPCASCKSASYCSELCFDAHWPYHASKCIEHA
jgi:MYND finger